MGLAVSLGACGAPPTQTPTENAVAPRFLPLAQNLTNAGYLPVSVKAFRGSGASRSEITGAQCRIRSIYFELELTTPGVAALPSLGRETPALRVTCRVDGQSKTVTAAPFNRTARNDAFILGAVGGGAGAAIAVATQPPPGNQVYTYRPIAVTFEN